MGRTKRSRRQAVHPTLTLRLAVTSAVSPSLFLLLNRACEPLSRAPGPSSLVHDRDCRRDPAMGQAMARVDPRRIGALLAHLRGGGPIDLVRCGRAAPAAAARADDSG